METPQPEAHPLTLLLEEYREFARRNTNYDPAKPTLEALAELNAVFFNADGNPHGERKILNNIAVIREVFRTRLEQIRVSPLWQAQQCGDAAPQVEKSRRTFAQRVQLKITHPADYKDLSAGIARKMPESRQIRVLIYHPKFLTDAFLKGLGLDEFIPDKKKLSRAEQIARRSEAIPEIQTMLSNLNVFTRRTDGYEPPEKSLRLYHIAKGRRAGYVLGTHARNGRLVFFSSDLPGTFRHFDRIEASYEREKGRLDKIAKILRTTHELLGPPHWQQTKHSRVAELRNDLQACVGSLEYVRGHHKKELREVIREMKTLCDSRGRSNPGALRAKIISIFSGRRRFFESRAAEVDSIKPNLKDDRGLVKSYLEEEREIFIRLFDMIDEYGGKLFDPEYQLVDGDIPEISKNISALCDSCERSRFEPYFSFAKIMLHHLQRTRGILNRRGRPMDKKRPASRAFIRAFVVAKVQRFYAHVMALYDCIEKDCGASGPGGFDSRLDGIDGLIETRQAAQGIFTPEWDSMWSGIRDFLAKLRENVARMEAETRDKKRERADEIKKEIRTFIDGDLLLVVRSMAPNPKLASPGRRATII